ncbi:3-hydroxylacyl-ACP dehydratase [Achromobacter sp. HZ01]|uniref:3-hydroxylacyl-ACP dehydratase n=1 Tax=Achromobacter pulmonis TaxID=1389932 RepID=A0A2N8KQD9_9BURK|nr:MULTISPECIES: hotdog family protein [Achromobacter]MBO9328209.1 3-hydroxylacyl-ACP dehydratase [Achromobacter xylosoxidans]PND35655.1 3-hydroxylacyl-ACP dehydratase [Achromobacter pulmonis]RAP65938.1 3-hydroxylacyl-ACP dehydratase [Achromobacter sp. HZ01]
MIPWPIASLLPHAGDMILIDEIRSYDADSLCALAVVKPGPYSLADGSLPPWLGMELMAQAVGAWAGCRAREAGQPVKLGFLLGTRRYESHADALPAGARLTVQVRRGLADASGISVFECELHDGARLLAQARLNVYQPQDPNAFIQEESPE